MATGLQTIKDAFDDGILGSGYSSRPAGVTESGGTLNFSAAPGGGNSDYLRRAEIIGLAESAAAPLTVDLLLPFPTAGTGGAEMQFLLYDRGGTWGGDSYVRGYSDDRIVIGTRPRYTAEQSVVVRPARANPTHAATALKVRLHYGADNEWYIEASLDNGQTWTRVSGAVNPSMSSQWNAANMEFSMNFYNSGDTPLVAKLDNLNGTTGNGGVLLPPRGAPTPANMVFTAAGSGKKSDLSIWKDSDGYLSDRVPTLGDRVRLVGGVQLEVDGDWDFGHSPMDSEWTDLALYVDPTSQLYKPSGATATVKVRGNVTVDNVAHQAGPQPAGIDLTDITLVLSSALATDPRNTHYAIKQNVNTWGKRLINLTNFIVRSEVGVGFAPGEGNGYFTSDGGTGNPGTLTHGAFIDMGGAGNNSGGRYAYTPALGQDVQQYLTDVVFLRCGVVSNANASLVGTNNKVRWQRVTLVDPIATMTRQKAGNVYVEVPMALDYSVQNPPDRANGYFVDLLDVRTNGVFNNVYRNGVKTEDCVATGGFSGGVAYDSDGSTWKRNLYVIPPDEAGFSFANVLEEEYRLGSQHAEGNQKMNYTSSVYANQLMLDCVTEPRTASAFGFDLGEMNIDVGSASGITRTFRRCLYGFHRDGSAMQWGEFHGDRPLREIFDHCSGAMGSVGYLNGHSGTGDTNKARSSMRNCLMEFCVPTPVYNAYVVNDGADVLNLCVVRQGVTPVVDTAQPQDYDYNVLSIADDNDSRAVLEDVGVGIGYKALLSDAVKAAQGNFGQHDIRGVLPFATPHRARVELFYQWARSIGCTDNADHFVTEQQALNALVVGNLSAAKANPAFPTGHPQYIAAATHAGAINFFRTAWTPTNSALAAVASDGTTPGAVNYVPATYINIKGVSAVVEGDVGTDRPVTITFERQGSMAGAASAQWAVIPGTASSTDFTGPVTGTVSYADGEGGVKTATFLVKGDDLVEDNETYRIRLSLPVNAVLGSDVEGVIVDNDYPDPTLAVQLGDGTPVTTLEFTAPVGGQVQAIALGLHNTTPGRPDTDLTGLQLLEVPSTDWLAATLGAASGAAGLAIAAAPDTVPSTRTMVLRITATRGAPLDLPVQFVTTTPARPGTPAAPAGVLTAIALAAMSYARIRPYGVTTAEEFEGRDATTGQIKTAGTLSNWSVTVSKDGGPYVPAAAGGVALSNGNLRLSLTADELQARRVRVALRNRPDDYLDQVLTFETIGDARSQYPAPYQVWSGTLSALTAQGATLDGPAPALPAAQLSVELRDAGNRVLGSTGAVVNGSGLTFVPGFAQSPIGVATAHLFALPLETLPAVQLTAAGAAAAADALLTRRPEGGVDALGADMSVGKALAIGANKTVPNTAKTQLVVYKANGTPWFALDVARAGTTERPVNGVSPASAVSP